MNLVTVRCNNCGAPLQVSDSAKYVTCNFCNTQLAIRATDSAVFTEQIEALVRKTDDIAENLDVIRIQNEIEKLDREFAMERERHLVSGKDGTKQEPSSISAIIGGVLAIVFAIFWMGGASSAGAPPFFSAFGIIFIVAALVMIITSVAKSSSLDNARSRYESQRALLEAELSKAQAGL